MWRSAGNITVTAAGTPVRVTSSCTPCQTVLFQQLEGNSGKLWVCDRADAVTSTGEGVLAIIAAPTVDGGVARVLPYASVTVSTAPNALDLASFWVDADNNGDICQVSYITH